MKTASKILLMIIIPFMAWSASGIALAAALTVASKPLPAQVVVVPLNTAAPAVSTINASSIAANSARLNGDLTSLGSASSLTASFLWGTTSGNLTDETAPAETKTAIGAFSFDLTGLNPGTTYFYKAKAAGSETVYGEEKSFTTLIIPVRTLPATVSPGQTFDVTITFVSPANNFNCIGISENAPVGWNAQANISMCTPNAMESRVNGNKVDYIWAGPYPKGQAFTVLYKVIVPAGVAAGNYSFSGTLGYFIGSSQQTSNITGATQVQVGTGQTGNPVRDVLTRAVRGKTIDVTITFSAPADNTNAIGLSDFAPSGWTVQTDKTWCTPDALEYHVTNNRAQYIWDGPYTQGTPFTAVYRVTIPSDAAPGLYSFTNGTLIYYVGSTGPNTVNITGKSQLEVFEGALISGETWDSKGVILGEVTVILDGTTCVVSDAQGNYLITGLTIGTHTLVATKSGFRNKTQTINVASLVDEYTLKFKGINGLIPCDVDLTYVLADINKWKFPPADTELGLNLSTVLGAINAWKFPIPVLSPAYGAAGTVITISNGFFAAGTSGTVWFDSDGDSVHDAGEPEATVTTTTTGVLPSGVTLTVPSVAYETYRIHADIPTGGTVESSAAFIVMP